MTESLTQVSRHIMRFLLFAVVVAVLGHGGARGHQNTITGYNQVIGQWVAAHAARTNNSRTGTGSPNGRDECDQPGESYFQTDATAGLNVWYCTATGYPGTWTNGNSGGTGTVTSVGCGTFGASWLNCSFGSSTTTTPILVLSAATGQPLRGDQFARLVKVLVQLFHECDVRPQVSPRPVGDPLLCPHRVHHQNVFHSPSPVGLANRRTSIGMLVGIPPGAGAAEIRPAMA